MASRLYEILRKDVFSDIETGPCIFFSMPSVWSVAVSPSNRYVIHISAHAILRKMHIVTFYVYPNQPVEMHFTWYIFSKNIFYRPPINYLTRPNNVPAIFYISIVNNWAKKYMLLVGFIEQLFDTEMIHPKLRIRYSTLFLYTSFISSNSNTQFVTFFMVKLCCDLQIKIAFSNIWPPF